MFSHLLGKKFALRSRILNCRGQGTVEYVLLVAISVGIILGLMNQFYQPFNKYLTTYMGPYLQCLLDVGELPALGWDKTEGVCNSALEPLKPGTPSVAGSSPSHQPAKNPFEDPKDPAARGETQASTASSSSGRRQPGSSLRLDGSSGGADGANEASDKLQKIPVELGETKYFNISQASGMHFDAQGRMVRAVGLAGLLDAEKQRLERDRQRIKQVGAIGDEGSDVHAKKMRVKEPQRKIASSDQDDPSWSFGKFMRLALIVMLLIAILLFLGGQALQISKSMDN